MNKVNRAKKLLKFKIQIEQKDKNESEVSGILEIENGEEIKDVQSEIIQQNDKYESKYMCRQSRE